MINKEDAVSGAIVTVNQHKKVFSGGTILNLFADTSNKEWQCPPGTQLEILKGPKKINNINLIKVKIVGSDIVGNAYWIDFKPNCDLTAPSSTMKEKVTANIETDLKLNSNEEFVLVNKEKPELVLRNINYDHLTKDKDDVLEHSFIFSTKSGKRKAYKNIQSLYGFLNHNSGMICKGKWGAFYEGSHKTKESKEQEYHLDGLNNTWLSVGGAGNPVEDWNYVELRKYNKDTKKVSTQPVDFDCHTYVTKFIKTMSQTRLFGEAISNVTNQLVEQNKLETHSHLFSTKFNFEKYEYSHDIPKDKDIYFDLALKELNLKKKDVIHYNQNGFLAVAFESEEQRKIFADTYKNAEKIVKLLTVEEVLNHPEIATEFDAKNRLKI